MDKETRKFWQQRRREMLRRDRRAGRGAFNDAPITKVFLGLMVLTWIAMMFFPGPLELLLSGPAGGILTYVLSALYPGDLLGLLFEGVFVWIVGSAIEPMTTWWQYLVVFFGSAFIAGTVEHLASGASAGASLAAYGLAGAYVRLMMHRHMEGALRWVLLLLLFNLVLSGFQPLAMVGILAAFGAGFGLALAVQIDR